jgi:hypothetical protein
MALRESGSGEVNEEKRKEGMELGGRAVWKVVLACELAVLQVYYCSNILILLIPFNMCLSCVHQLPITKWPHQSEAPVGEAPPTRSQLRLQRQS